jgi:hypothetical protein
MLWAVVGTAALLAGLALSFFSALVSFAAGRRDDPFVARAARRGFYAAAAMVVLASGCLLAGLLGHDFRLAYVTAHTDRALATPLIAAAFYSGQEGSLLYWTLVLTVLGSASVAAAGGAGVRLRAYATGVLAAIATFLLVVMVFAASPFDLLTLTPRDGLGLNPVLRDGGMLIHPPFLLAGFSAFSIPFSFALAALLAGRQDAAWIAQTRRVGLLAWATGAEDEDSHDDDQADGQAQVVPTRNVGSDQSQQHTHRQAPHNSAERAFDTAEHGCRERVEQHRLHEVGVEDGDRRDQHSRYRTHAGGQAPAERQHPAHAHAQQAAHLRV